jgi:hypothetical protein
MKHRIPSDFDPRTICLSMDAEWASDAVIADFRSLLDERGLKATFFVTHEGISVPGHERGIHPNFHRDGDVMRALYVAAGADAKLDDTTIYDHVVGTFKSFAPEACGVRGHRLHYDSMVLPVYQRHGIQYDSTYQMPLLNGLVPFWKEHDLLELPIYFNDYFDLKTGTTDFNVRSLDLEAEGLKVIDLHPNIVFLNAATVAQYDATKGFYKDTERLLAARNPGRGIRSLVLELLDRIVAARLPTMTLGEVNARWRAARDAV